ncbi:MAG: VWA domain-containing protein [Halobacteriota archaeon]
MSVAGMVGAAAANADSTNETTESAAAVDIVIVFDRSESTNEDRYHMAQEVDRLASRFDDAGIDARYGLVTYNEANRIEQPLTGDFASFEKAMHFAESGHEERASDAILTATDMDFRDDAERVIVVVTDEDDDSTNATRSTALSSLSGVDFVAVSPATPSESSCVVHSPPCDNRSDNELRTMATQVDGDWIDESQSAGVIVSEIATIAESTVDTEEDSSSDTPRKSSSHSPAYSTVNHSANRTTAEVGDLIRFNKTIENVGSADGSYDAYLSHDGTILAEQTVSIPEDESRTISFVHQFEEAGEYEVLISHEPIATVTVTEPNNVSVDVRAAANESRVNGTITDAWTNDTVSIPMNDSGLVPAEVAVIKNVTVAVGDVNVTPAHDVAFDFEVLANETPPNGTEPVSEHVAQVRYLTVNSTLGAGLDGVEFEYVASANETTLYGYDAANATWTPLNQTAVNATESVWHTNRSNASVYAVGVRQPSISVTDATLEANAIETGESTTALVTLSNEGVAAGTFNTTLRVNDRALSVERTTVPAGENRTVTFQVAPEQPGEYAVDVVDGPSMTLQVDAPQTETPTATPTTTVPDASLTSVPGFGVGVALLAFIGAALLAGRRR